MKTTQANSFDTTQGTGQTSSGRANQSADPGKRTLTSSLPARGGSPAGSGPIQLKRDGNSAGMGPESFLAPARAPIQRKGTGASKAGSEGAQKENDALAHAGESERATQLVALLQPGTGSNDKFQKVAKWIMGGDPETLKTEFAQASDITTLENAIKGCFTKNPWQERYLVSTLNNKGEPSLAMRLALSAGLVTGTNPHWSEVVRLLRKAKADDVKNAFDEAKNPGAGSLRATLEKEPRVASILETQAQQQTFDQGKDLAELPGSPDQPDDVGQVASVEDRRKPLHDAKDAELAALVEYYGNNRDKLATALKAWVKDQKDQDESLRVEVTTAGSKFLTALNKQKLKPTDVTYLVELVKKPETLSADILVRPDSEKKDDAEEQTKADEESSGKIAEVDAYVTRKETSKGQGGIGRNHLTKDGRLAPPSSTLKSKIEELSDTERDAFLRTKLTAAEVKTFDDPATSAEDRGALRQQAIDAIKAQLATAGYPKETIERTVSAFQFGAAPKASLYQSTYQQLRRLVTEKMHMNFSATAFRMVGQLANQEYLQVRRDAALMAALEKRCDKAHWGRICQILGHDPKNEEESKLLPEDKAGVGSGEARDLAANQAEYDPGHWSALLAREFEKGKINRSGDKVNSVATRAYYAGLRRSELPGGESEGTRAASEKTVPKGMGPMDVTTFTAEVLARLDDKQRLFLKTERTAAFNALTEGKPVSAEERIEGATFAKLSPKRLKGTGARSADIIRAVKDGQGTELLEQWSNFPVWKALKEQRDALKGDEAKKADLDAKQAAMNSFVLDLSDEVKSVLRKELPREQQAKVLEEGRKVLATAAEKDPAFKAGAKEQSLSTDDYAVERIKGRSLLEKQRLEDTGAQWEHLMGVIPVSVKSTEAKESRNIVAGRMRTAHSELNTAEEPEPAAEGESKPEDKAKDHAKKIKEGREEHEKRIDSAKDLKTKANEITEAVVGVVIGAAVMGATFGTGLAGAPLIGMAIGRAVAISAAKAALKYTLQGNKFNAWDTLTGIATETAVTSINLPFNIEVMPEIVSQIGTKGPGVGNALGTAGVRFAINTAVGQSINTAVDRATAADRYNNTIGREALSRLRALGQDVATLIPAFAALTAVPSVPEGTPKGTVTAEQAKVDAQVRAIFVAREFLTTAINYHTKPLDETLKKNPRKVGDNKVFEDKKKDKKAEETAADTSTTPDTTGAEPTEAEVLEAGSEIAAAPETQAAAPETAPAEENAESPAQTPAPEPMSMDIAIASSQLAAQAQAGPAFPAVVSERMAELFQMMSEYLTTGGQGPAAGLLPRIQTGLQQVFAVVAAMRRS